LLRGKRCRPRPSGSRRNSAPLVDLLPFLHQTFRGRSVRGVHFATLGTRQHRFRDMGTGLTSKTRSCPSVNSRGKKLAGYLHIHKAAASPPSGDVGCDTCAVTYHGRDRGKHTHTDQRTFEHLRIRLLPGLRVLASRAGGAWLATFRRATLSDLYSGGRGIRRYGRLLLFYARDA